MAQNITNRLSVAHHVRHLIRTVSLSLTALLLLSTSVLYADPQIRLEVFVTGLNSPTEMVQDPTLPNVQYVVEQAGTIRVIQDGVLLNRPFLDLTDVVSF